MRHRSGPRISQALHYFEAQKRAFLILEHIELTHPSLVTNLAERAAWALDWLSGVSAPPEDVIDHSKDVIGPIGGGPIRHSFFKNNKAPLTFSSVDALERYMNKVRRCLYFFKCPPSDNILFVQGRQLLSKLATDPAKPIIIVNESLIFTQSDIHVSNFANDNGNLPIWPKSNRTVLSPHRRQSTLWNRAVETASSPVSPTSCVGRTAPIRTQWSESLIVYGWRPVRNLVRRLVFEIGVKPTFVIGLDEDGRRKPKRVKPQAYRGQITEH